MTFTPNHLVVVRVLGSAAIWFDPWINNFIYDDPRNHTFETFATLSNALAYALNRLDHKRSIGTLDPYQSYD